MAHLPQALIICWLAGASATAPVEPVESTLLVVNLQPTAEVAAATVTLGDLAPLPSDSPLAGIEIAPAPLAGYDRVVTRDQVAVRIERSGQSLAGLALQGATRVRVTRAVRQLGAEDLAAAVARLTGVAVTLERVGPLRPMPLGEVTYEPRGPLPSPLPERFSLSLDILVDGQVCNQVQLVCRQPLPDQPVTAESSAVAAAAVAPVVPAGGGERGASLGVRPTVVAAPAPPLSPPAAVSLAAGEVAPPVVEPTRAVVAQAADAVPPAAPTWQVKRGDRITVICVSGRVRVSLAAEARESGGYGDVIQLQATVGVTKRTVSARLVAADRAVLELN